MDALYSLGEAGAAEIQGRLPNPPGYSAIRAMLRILEEKGHIRHEEKGLRYVFRPTVPRDTAKRSALKHLVQTFFDGSPEQVVSTLLDSSSKRMSAEELDRLAALIEKAKKEGR